jgi:hypothetical protein
MVGKQRRMRRTDDEERTRRNGRQGTDDKERTTRNGQGTRDIQNGTAERPLHETAERLVKRP